MTPAVKPSRTYNLAIYGIVAELVLALLVAVIAIWQPDALDSASEVLLMVAGGVAASSGVGSGAMGFRDGMSGGRTTSQADTAMFNPPDEGSGEG